MPFGLTNALACTMNPKSVVFMSSLDKCVVALINDSLVQSKSGEDHAELLRIGLQTS